MFEVNAWSEYRYLIIDRANVVQVVGAKVTHTVYKRAYI